MRAPLFHVKRWVVVLCIPDVPLPSGVLRTRVTGRLLSRSAAVRARNAIFDRAGLGDEPSLARAFSAYSAWLEVRRVDRHGFVIVPEETL